MYPKPASCIFTPQRSRRLSASGMRTARKTRGRSWMPQRSRRLSASGIRTPRRAYPWEREASKKQTPFSVWYEYLLRGDGVLPDEPQRSRRLSASGMRQNRALVKGAFAVPQRSRRLSASGMPPVCMLTSGVYEPQRSRRLSASGIRMGSTRSPTPSSSLKEADAFQRLVWRCCGRRREGVGVASKK